MEASDNDYGDLASVLKGNTSMFIAETANGPAKVIKEFRKKVKTNLQRATLTKKFILVTTY